VQLQLGRHLEAVADCRAALALDPHNAQLRALREQIAAGCRAAAALAAAPVAPRSRPASAAGLRPAAALALALPQPLSASGAGSLQGSARLAAPAAAAEQLPGSPDAFAGFDTPEAVRQQAKLCMVCMDADRGGRRLAAARCLWLACRLPPSSSALEKGRGLPALPMAARRPAADARLLPCSHACLCCACARSLQQRQFGCPICSAAIQGIERGQFTQTYELDAV
jgi:hypothetical protein